MVAAILKFYFIGTALSIFAVFYGLMDSFGGLMYVQDSHHMLGLDQHTQIHLSSGNQERGNPVARNIGL